MKKKILIILFVAIFAALINLKAADCSLPDRSRADWFKQDTGTGIVEDDFEVTSGQIKIEVFPNPGKNIFRIRINLKKDSFLRIEIDDLNGKLVKNISNTLVISPEQNFEWNLDNNSGEKVGEGIYFLNVKSNKIHLSKKLIIE